MRRSFALQHYAPPDHLLCALWNKTSWYRTPLPLFHQRKKERGKKNRWNLNSLGQLFRVKKVALWTQEMKEWFSQIWINCRFIVLGLRKKENSRKTWINLNCCVTLIVILGSERTMPFICTITIYTTVCFFTTATKEHLISRLSDELQSSAWSQIKGHWLRFLSLKSISSLELMQSFKNSSAFIPDFCRKCAFI